MSLDPIWKASVAGLLNQLGPHTPDRRYMLVLDTSGGMAFTVREILGVAMFLVRYIPEKIGKHVPITVMQFDTQVRNVQEINSPEEAVRITLMSGGGTLCSPVSEYMRNVAEPITAICITDGYFGDCSTYVGKPEDRMGWFLLHSKIAHQDHLPPGPQVFAQDSRWILMGDGPMLYNEENEYECD